MSIAPVSSTSSNPADVAQSVAAANSASTALSASDFMKLLSTQMQNQDPLQPMDPTQSMTQLAQFSSLQQMSDLSQSQGIATANTFLGGQVTIKSPTGGAPVTGIVSGVDLSGTAPAVVVNGTSYALSSITQVQVPQAASSTSSGSSTGN